MEEQRYLISDAAKIVAVEAHVLRYWEEELGLSIGRNELGHRYYTRENIETFQKVKELKEEGLQLRAIRTVLKKAQEAKEEAARKEQQGGEDTAEEAQKETLPREYALQALRSNGEKLQQFKELVEEIVEKVVKANNEELQRRLEESMAKETDYLLRMQEQREEERYRRFDEIVREHQKNSRYVAAAKEKRRLWDKLMQLWQK